MKYSADTECEIIHCVNCEISHFVRCEMKFALHICEANISQRSYFTWALPNFTRRRRISLKKAHLRCRCAFFWRRHPSFALCAKIPTPCAWCASTPTFGRGNRTGFLARGARKRDPSRAKRDQTQKSTPIGVLFCVWRRHPDSDRG